MTTTHAEGRRAASHWSGYRIIRKPRGTFDDRLRYLVDEGSPQPLQLCQILGRRDTDRTTLPWVTAVLGSGCLESTDGIPGRVLARTVGDALVDHHLPGPQESAATQAEKFTLSLIADRLGTADANVPFVGGADRLNRAAPGLVLATCLLTRAFHAVMGTRPDAVSRWDDDVVTFDVEDESAADYEDIRVRLVRPATSILGRVRGLLRDDGVDDGVAMAVDTLIDDVIRDLTESGPGTSRLRLQQLRLITEIAWYYLVGDTTAYPGWADLLLRLMLRGDDRTGKAARQVRPRYLDQQLFGKYIDQLLKMSTDMSWARRISGADSARPAGVFEAVAKMLWAQQAVLVPDQNATPNRQLPPASAFVTSFDLELEMSLWLRARGRAFAIAVPVHVLRNEDDDQAALCWMVADIDPARLEREDGLAELRNPRRWRVVHPNVDPQELRRRPTVVHLNGCPLVTLPDVNDLADESVRGIRGELVRLGLIDASDTDVRLGHAVTIDEYLALRQSAVETFWASENSANPEGRKSRALPSALAGDTRSHARYWMVLGVPIGDPAIRHRITSHLTIRDLVDDTPRNDLRQSAAGMPQRPKAAAVEAVDADPTAEPVQPTRLSGIAVNKRINDDEASVMHWLGLDVVRTTCDEFVADLLHYVDHVTPAGVTARVPKTGCTTTAEGNRK